MASGKAYLKLIIKNRSHEKVIPFLVTPYGLHEFSVRLSRKHNSDHAEVQEDKEATD